MQTRKLSASFEGLNISLAQSSSDYGVAKRHGNSGWCGI